MAVTITCPKCDWTRTIELDISEADKNHILVLHDALVHEDVPESEKHGAGSDWRDPDGG